MAAGSCFISYCHDGCDPDSVKAFVSALRERGRGEFSVLHDDDLKPGGDLREFMKRLSSVDAVVILMSPSYKRKVLARQESVYTEYSTIRNRYELSQKARRSGKGLDEITRYFDIIPVLWAGDREASVPPDIGYLKYVDFTSFRASVAKGSAHREGFARSCPRRWCMSGPLA